MRILREFSIRPANDRHRLERLCRYVGRPPVATQRLSKMDDGRLLYELRHRWRDGTTHVAFEPLELIGRLAALVPPPRFHTVRYHGVLASRSKHRADVVPVKRRPTPSEPPDRRGTTAGPSCKAKPMRILAAIHPPSTTEAILKSLGLPTRAPPISPAEPVSEDRTLAEPKPTRNHENHVGLCPLACSA